MTVNLTAINCARLRGAHQPQAGRLHGALPELLPLARTGESSASLAVSHTDNRAMQDVMAKLDRKLVWLTDVLV